MASAIHRPALVAAIIATTLAPIPASLHAQGTPSMSLAEAIDRALRQHPSLGMADAARDEARAIVNEAKAARLPSVAIAGSATRYKDPMLVTPLHGFNPGQLPPFDRTLYQGAANLSYTLFDGGAREARIRRGREGLGAADADVAAAGQALLARVASTYAQVIARQEVAAAHANRVAALDAELREARKRLDAGTVARVEVLRAEAALEAARAEQSRAAGDLDVAERDLARLTGSSVDESRASRLEHVVLKHEPLPDRDELLAVARANSPALDRARRQQAAAQAGIALARASRLPEVKLGGAWVERGSAGTRSWGEWNAGAALSVPVFTGGATTAEVDRASVAARAAGEQLRLASLQLEQDVDRARAAATEARARAASLATAEERYAEVARIQRLARGTGSGTQVDYLAAESELLLARASHAEALVSELAARIELARITGELSQSWLARTLESTR